MGSVPTINTTLGACEGLDVVVAMVVSPRPERWQSAFVCPELDSAVVPSVRGQPGTKSLFILAYNLGTFLRRLCLPKAVRHWSLRSVQVKLIKMGGRLVRHARRLTGLAGPDYDATISFGLPFEPEDSQYGEYWPTHVKETDS